MLPAHQVDDAHQTDGVTEKSEREAVSCPTRGDDGDSKDGDRAGRAWTARAERDGLSGLMMVGAKRLMLYVILTIQT